MAGNCYTHPLIAPNLPLNHPCTNSCNSKGYTLKHDPEFCKFAEACQVATGQAAIDHQEHQFFMLEKTLLPELLVPENTPSKS